LLILQSKQAKPSGVFAAILALGLINSKTVVGMPIAWLVYVSGRLPFVTICKIKQNIDFFKETTTTKLELSTVFNDFSNL